METSPIPDFRQWHEVYLSISPYPFEWGVSARLRYEHLWSDLNPKPTVEDLRLVMRFILKRMQQGKRNRESFRLYNLLDPDRFQYDLTDARHAKNGEARKPAYGEREKILEATGRQPYAENQARTPEQILKDKKFFEKCKREAGLI